MFKLSLLILAVSILYYFYQLPSGIEPIIWKNPTPLNKLERNDILKNVIKLHENSSIVAPESFGFDTITGYVYGGLADGRVVQFDEHGEYLKDVIFTGGFVRHYRQSNGINDKTYNGIKGNEELLQYCKEEVKAHRLAWNTTAEQICGRPLGNRVVISNNNIDQNNNNRHSILYIADAYHGIFEIDLSTWIIRHLVTSQTPIHIPTSGDGNSGNNSVLSLPVKFFNDLDLLGYETGTTTARGSSTEKVIIFTDSSYRDTRSQNRVELIDGAPRGRLFQYNIQTQTLTLLLCGLHFPNGVQIVPSSFPNRRHHRFILVVELARFRVLKVNYDLLLESLSLDAQSLQGQRQQQLSHHPDSNEKGETNINDMTKKIMQTRSETTTKHIDLLQCCSESGSLYQYLVNHSYIPSPTTTSRLPPHSGGFERRGEYNPPGGNPNHIVSVFIEGVTGVIDNIRLVSRLNHDDGSDKLQTTNKHSHKGKQSQATSLPLPTTPNDKTFLLMGAGTKSAYPFSFLHLAYQSNWLRHIICKLIPMKYIEKVVPKYGLVYKVNLQGKIIGTYQDPTGHHVSMISEAQRHPKTGDLWLGSHSNRYLAILPSQYAV